MTSIPTWLLVHQATVERHTGVNADGATYAAAETVACMVDHSNQLVRLPDRRDTVATTQIYLHIDTDPGPVGSRWTVDGVTQHAVRVESHRSGGLPIPAHHRVTLGV